MQRDLQLRYFVRRLLCPTPVGKLGSRPRDRVNFKNERGNVLTALKNVSNKSASYESLGYLSIVG